jgi:hypothetical protein
VQFKTNNGENMTIDREYNAAEQAPTDGASQKPSVPAMAPLPKARVAFLHIEAEGDSETISSAMDAILAALGGSNVSDETGGRSS